MMTVYRVNQVEYYLNDNTDEDKAAKKEAGAYYTDNDTDSHAGVMWNSLDVEGTIPKTATGEVIDTKAFRALAEGKNPVTGEKYRQNQKSATGLSTVGYDLQFAAPKSLSVLWAMSDAETRARIEQIVIEAAQESLDYVARQGLITTRRGKGSLIHEMPAELCAGTFLHTTSREGDPQIHAHNVILNVCVRQDGTTGGIDNKALLDVQHEVGAVNNIILTQKLHAAGIAACVREEHNFKVSGIPNEVCDVFSSRRKAIIEAAKRAGVDTSNREAMDAFALVTRKVKSKEDGYINRIDTWIDTVEDAGFKQATILEMARLGDKSDEELSPLEVAIKECEEHKSVFSEKELRLAIFEAWIGRGSVEDAERDCAAALRGLEGKLFYIGDEQIRKRGEDEVHQIDGKNVIIEERPEFMRMFTTSKQIGYELSLLKLSTTRQDEGVFFKPADVERAIKAKKTMSEEQAEAVRHALNNDGISIVEGSAGTGKSFSMAAVAECARDCGAQVYVLAPSHKAKQVIREDTGSDEKFAKTVQGFVKNYEAGLIELDKSTVIILDEAGMVDNPNCAQLLEIAKEHHCKVVFTGDTRQLKPVGAGAPMVLLREHLGTQRIGKIRRQKKEWMRKASMLMSEATENNGKMSHALDMYFYPSKRGIDDPVGADAETNVIFLAKDQVIERLADDNVRDALNSPDGTRVVITQKNADVHLLNASIREKLQQFGVVGDEDVVVRAKQRGKDAQEVELKLSVGDRIIFGGNKKESGQMFVQNNDVGTILEIKPNPEDASDPIVKIKFDNGKERQTAWSGYAGMSQQDYKDANKKNKRRKKKVVEAQHAYAVTVYASQGMTVDKSFVYISGRVQRSLSYVAMTRHRHDMQIYIDQNRFTGGATKYVADVEMKLGEDGKIRDSNDDIIEIPKERNITLTEDEMKKAIAKIGSEMNTDERKKNISDYIEDVNAWIKSGNKQNIASFLKKRESEIAEIASLDVTPQTETEITVHQKMQDMAALADEPELKQRLRQRLKRIVHKIDIESIKDTSQSKENGMNMPIFHN